MDREQVSLLRALLPIDGFTKGPFVGSHLFTQFKNHVNNKRSKQKMVCLNCRSCEETRGEDANCEDHVDTKHSRGKLCYSNEHCRGNEPERKEGREGGVGQAGSYLSPPQDKRSYLHCGNLIHPTIQSTDMCIFLNPPRLYILLMQSLSSAFR